MNEAPRKPVRFLTVEQAALELNVSDAAIRSLLHNRELRGFQVGGRGQWRTGLEDLQAYIDGAYRKVEEKISRGEFAEAEAGTSKSQLAGRRASDQDLGYLHGPAPSP